MSRFISTRLQLRGACLCKEETGLHMFSGVRPSSAAASSNSPCTSNHGAAGDLSTAAPVLAAPYTHLQSRRDCVLQPRVARNELPWVMSACAPQLRRSCAINGNNAMPQSLGMGLIIRGVGATSSGVERGGRPSFPRVARCSLPWALLQNPFGIPARLPA